MGFEYDIINIEGDIVDSKPIKWLVETYNYHPKDIKSFLQFCINQIEKLSNRLMIMKQDISEIRNDIIKNLDKHDNLEDLLRHLKLKIELYEEHPSRYYDIEFIEFNLDNFENLKIFLDKYNNQLYQGELSY
jgi:actin-related protein